MTKSLHRHHRSQREWTEKRRTGGKYSTRQNFVRYDTKSAINNGRMQQMSNF